MILPQGQSYAESWVKVVSQDGSSFQNTTFLKILFLGLGNFDKNHTKRIKSWVSPFRKKKKINNGNKPKSDHGI